MSSRTQRTSKPSHRLTDVNNAARPVPKATASTKSGSATKGRTSKATPATKAAAPRRSPLHEERIEAQMAPPTTAAALNEMIRFQKEEKLKLQRQKEEGIRARSAAMAAAESSDEEEYPRPPPRKSVFKPTPKRKATPSPAASDEESDRSPPHPKKSRSSLPSKDQTEDEDDEDEDDEEDNEQMEDVEIDDLKNIFEHELRKPDGDDDEDEDDNMPALREVSDDEDGPADYDEEDEDDFFGGGEKTKADPRTSNGIFASPMTTPSPTRRPRKRNSQGQPLTRDGKVMTASQIARAIKAKTAYKVTAVDFSPHSRAVGEAARAKARSYTALKDAYPGPSASEKDAAMANILKLTVSSSKNVFFDNVLERCDHDEELYRKLLTFTGYGRSALLNAIIGKARNALGEFGIPADLEPAEIADRVKFLLKDGHFKYAELNLVNKTFNAAKPWAAPFIRTMVSGQFFPNSRARADVHAFQELVEMGTIPPQIFALLATAMEHAIGQWSEGTFRVADFTDAVKVRYVHHLDSFNHLAKSSPTWTRRHQKALFDLIMTQTNRSFLISNGSLDMPDIDAETLEAEALQAEADEAAAIAAAGPAPAPAAPPA